METYFSGTIERVIFENASNFFKIILLTIEETDSYFDDVEIIVTGTIAEVVEGEQYTFWGNLTQHPRYGEQLAVTRYERAKPSASGLVKYFSSDQFKGIGKKIAEKIVATYGDEDTIDRILEAPEHLTTITGLSKVKREGFLATLKVNYGTEQILSKLAEYGLSIRFALQIIDKYKDKSLSLVQENPYQLVEDIQGIGFKTADQLAEQLGIDSQSPQRFRAALFHSLLEGCLETGDTYMEDKQLLERALYLLEDARQVEIDPAQVAQELSDLIIEDKVQQIETKIFDNSLYFAEQGIHRHLTRLLDNHLGEPIADEELDDTIVRVQDELGISYDQTQKDAIAQALNSKVFILTGGPGTGKTTVINGILSAYGKLHGLNMETRDLPIVLAAPTGRAARRMTELTGLPAATIHRHLGLTTEGDYQTLDDYLDADLVIVDEFSMVDTWLANQLFAAISSNTQLIIVGDSDQLPSVGPGQVLADLLKVDNLSQVALTKIFRQSDDSTIVTLASQMKAGSLPADFTQKKADRSYFEAQAQFIPDMVTKIVSSAMRSGIAPQDIQVLAPMYRGPAGITVLNQLLQNLINPKDDQLEFAFNETLFREGDKVLHLVNDPESNVFNGDIGVISQLELDKYTDSKQDELTIAFEGNEVTYPRKDWGKITLAYAMSIHRSQGSEFPVVILPITRGASRMLQRNLLYTAITRAKSKLVMLGEVAAFNQAVRTQGSLRATYLVERFLGENSRAEQAETDKTTDKLTDTLNQTTAGTETLQSVPSPVTDPQTTHPAKKSTTLETSPPSTLETYTLNRQNLLTIDPMIGVTEADIEHFFGK
ncbi:ATP-dependent RecD-like DNA helicase [Streptococcus sp. E24BD]|uniref:SF1B family DNA helicase RecD2 n=1 Tax=Streptococcus sp. E24BD TaxID=3278715 RepID=UPI00359E5F0A